MEPRLGSRRGVCAAILALGLALAAAAPARADDQEAAIGARVYADLAARGQIVERSPLYDVLEPIGRRIKAVADPKYDAPFSFVIVRDRTPNAFSVPGGRVYVTDALFGFLANREQLAGALCHEVAHTIHHDVTALMRKNQNLSIGATLLSVLLGGNPTVGTAINVAASLQSLSFTRDVERNADFTGADLCAAANLNPWGLVWLLDRYRKSDAGGGMEMLSDHPRDDHRITDLEQRFAENPGTFARFNRDPAHATPLR